MSTSSVDVAVFEPFSASWIKIVALEIHYIRFIFQTSIICISVSKFVTDNTCVWCCTLKIISLDICSTFTKSIMNKLGAFDTVENDM